MFYIGFWISIRSLLLSGASVQNFLQKTLTIFWNFPDLNPWKSPLIVKFYSLKKYRTNGISLRDSENVLSSNIWENLWIAVCITVKIYQYKRKCRDIDINIEKDSWRWQLNWKAGLHPTNLQHFYLIHSILKPLLVNRQNQKQHTEVKFKQVFSMKNQIRKYGEKIWNWSKYVKVHQTRVTQRILENFQVSFEIISLWLF